MTKKGLRPIRTYTLALDNQLVISLEKEFPKNQILEFDHIESFYNFRTIGDFFEFETSILSNKEVTLPVTTGTYLRIMILF